MRNKYTSLKLSKMLDEAGFREETEYMYVNKESKIVCRNEQNRRRYKDFYFPAYDLLWDICIKYTKEIFGEEYVCKSCGAERPCKQDFLHLIVCCKKYEKGKIEKYKYCTKKISNLLQQGKKQEAEDYIIKNSSLFEK